MYLSRRLEEQGYHVFMGITDRQTRQERLREAIMARGCDSTIIGAIPGTRRPETYSAAWERIYGASFHVKPKRGAA
jgi:DNA-binding LacI/PurR family transcriptional regulator